MALRGRQDADWDEMVGQWKRTQDDLRSRMLIQPLRPLPRYVAGADAAFSADKTTVFAAAVLYDCRQRQVVEVSHAVVAAEVPYVPGFLSFREGPAVLRALRGLRRPFGAVLFDAQGYAHPRRCGLAAHLAIELDAPGVGVAKSRLTGQFKPPPPESGGWSDLLDDGEVIGSVLRTRAGIRPVFVSIGHRVDLASARALVLHCCTRYRLPEPTRLADIEVARLKRRHIEAG